VGCCHTSGVLADVTNNSRAEALPLFNLNIEKDLVPIASDALKAVEVSVAGFRV